jgi:hypothetical protein
MEGQNVCNTFQEFVETILSFSPAQTEAFEHPEEKKAA